MKRLVLLFAILAAFLPGLAVGRDKMIGPHSYKQVTSDGKFVFVMLYSRDVDHPEFSKEKNDSIRDIRAKYKNSGMYKNDGSDKPLWTVDWYGREVLVPSDGVHLVRLNATPGIRATKDRNKKVGPMESKQEVLAIFDRGTLLSAYSLAELIAVPSELPHSVSHIHWLKDHKLTKDEHQAEILTEENVRIRFKLQDGSIVEKVKEE
jgi:hypothetical protein